MLVYFGVLFSASLLVFLSQIIRSKAIWYCSLSIVCIFAGFRYFVGIDYESYTFIFFSITSSTTEPAFRLINLIVFLLKLNVQVVFFVSSLITFSFFYSGIKRNSENLFISVFILLFCGFFIESLNIIRQYIAISIFFFSIRFIVSKEFKKYLFCILFAMCFHYSAILLIFAYFILKLNIGKLWFPILILAYILPFFIPFKSIFGLIPGYNVYFDSGIDANGSAQLGIGFLSKLLIGFVCLITYEQIISKVKNAKIYLNGFFVYLFLMSFFRDFMVMVRLGYYFNVFLILLVPCLFKVFDKNGKLVLYILFFIYGCLLLSINLLDSSAKLVPYDYLIKFFDN